MPENKACFIDTNVWLYAFITEDEPKTKKAQAIIKGCEPVVSTQVINEVCTNLIKKAEFPEHKINQLIETFFAEYRVVESDKGIMLAASQLRKEYSLSFWDSTILAAALEAGVSILYSEDMQTDLIVRKYLRVINPFK